MRKIFLAATALAFAAACTTAYKARPVPFKMPAAYGNAVEVAGTVVGARAYVDAGIAEEAFGFDIRGAGMLPVQVVFDNRGQHPLRVNAEQTFLEDDENNLWSILDGQNAYERATKYAKTGKIFKEGAYHGFLGATAGAIIGAAIGIVAGENVAEAAGKGAAVGAAAGATLGGAKEFTTNEAPRVIMDDLYQKSLQNKTIEPGSIAYGILFFPGEAQSARRLRLQLQEVDTGTFHVLQLYL